LKARGVKLGNPRWAESIEKARQTRVKQIQRPSAPVVEMMMRLRLEGCTLRAIADRLNALGVRTPRGFRWGPSSVRSAIMFVEPRTPGSAASWEYESGSHTGHLQLGEVTPR
jgi:hypothetical protein